MLLLATEEERLQWHFHFKITKIQCTMHQDQLLVTPWKPLWETIVPELLILSHTITPHAPSELLQRSTQGQGGTVTTCTPKLDSPSRSCLRDPLGINTKFLTGLQKESGCLQDGVVCRPTGRGWIRLWQYSGCWTWKHFQNQESITSHGATNLMSKLSLCCPARFSEDLLITSVGCPQLTPRKINSIIIV